MKKVLIANRGENDRAAGVSSHCGACAAGDGVLAIQHLLKAKGLKS
ncbi:MAG: hypothetical protein KBH33_11765 [Alicycliphilus sp.]|jgi:hypothetical protein|uniref:Uncharacterized protein n=1 Tax=Diaphorobacter limosus TaxID=3036128 RepID=A0ABZ0J7D6_9BURK|nr:hypothetical protein [Diaphorobacter sp. Y-1]MBP6753288.1 hypothetical protein [Alicycliphilus sp.]MCA0439860.1 hypothetical protein [Pseudomonadota bacterium]MBP7326377.1 hypothetical protein [Alicycliphilus sp.]MBP7329366.1 hypothetical protein [Alicycliphilus sp.]MBP8137994.1 hypothetical protein [Alicycliphilus sp.]